MAVHRLSIGTFDEIDYKLIAIHTALEDYYLAFLINKNTPLLLSKTKENISNPSKSSADAWYTRFTYQHVANETTYHLIQNKTLVEVTLKQKSPDLFQSGKQSMTTTAYLLPEFKMVDYFLKVENGDDAIDKLTIQLQQIDQIATLYEVNTSLIKSKNNLIF